MNKVPYDLPKDNRLTRMRKEAARIAESCCSYK